MKINKIILGYLIIFNCLVIFILYNIMFRKDNYYLNLYNEINNRTIESISAPRGRILDRLGNILVDNKGIKVIVFNEIKGISDEEKEELALKLSNIIDMNYDNILKIMNNGYYYQDKIIKKNISDEELTKVNELNLIGVRIDIDYERVYNYDTCLNDLFGKVGSISKENKDYYLNKGYKLNDSVGISYLEEYYEDYLKGKKAKYRYLNDNKFEKISEEVRGNDLVLNIDIEKQLYIEKLIKEEIIKTKKYDSSKYYKGSLIVLSNTNGELISLVGYNYDNSIFKSNVLSIINNSYTVGSVVKGASQSVAFINNAIDPNKKIKDGCIKLYSQKEKCSWKSLGYLNDISALANSSNYYQFINVFNTLGIKYKYNMKFNVTESDFTLYRDIFSQYGLGSKSGIDLKNETLGIKGNKVSGDLLLNFSIGQYDTYSPLMLTSYINTISNNGIRYNLRLANSVINEKGKKKEINLKQELNQVVIEPEDLNRIKKGFYQVVNNGTGKSYFNKVKAAAKTGTSETFYNGIKTITRSLVSYFPYDTPKYSLSIISPNISIQNDVNMYSYPINSILSRKISDFLFEN